MTSRRNFAPPPLAETAEDAGALAPERAYDPSGRGSVHWTSTARSALRPVLLHLRRTGALPDKNAELLVPRWACNSLYNTVQKVCFPTIQDTPSLRGVMVYHQYGFPQRLDLIAQRCRERGLFMIENCVNCIFDGASTHGMGETGLASLFSLPKLTRTVLGGALVARDPALAAFCADYFRDDEPWIGRLSRTARSLTESIPGPRSLLFQEMVYAISDYGHKADHRDLTLLTRDLASGAIARRRANYARLRREFADTPFFEGLEADVIPFVAPLFGPPEFMTRLAARLSRDGWESGVYRFDAARNVFEPDYVPCVPLPVHQGLTDADLDRLVEAIRTEWRLYDGKL